MILKITKQVQADYGGVMAALAMVATNTMWPDEWVVKMELGE
ncbi:hypothetical protein RT717_18500 [Imperialibacter roseus]|uniref:Uncharacterized protein n=1 Tax=Imperialibacter roseus TaxID=1324217 RepID=A0ABZ0IMU5_9BACT|nr:hypothetical protein [Imperialibacter roseus]WOK05076.1 hypothetical protein RT717_18500 [Imperialibacter roseus]